MECGDWKRGSCYRGSSCRYVHDGAQTQARRTLTNKDGSCAAFSSGTCYRGAKCKFPHGPVSKPGEEEVAAQDGIADAVQHVQQVQQPTAALQGPYVDAEGKHYYYNPLTMQCEWGVAEGTGQSQPSYPAVQPAYDAAQLAAVASQPSYDAAQLAAVAAQPSYDAAQLAAASAQPTYPQLHAAYPPVQIVDMGGVMPSSYPSVQPGYSPAQILAQMSPADAGAATSAFLGTSAFSEQVVQMPAAQLGQPQLQQVQMAQFAQQVAQLPAAQFSQPQLQQMQQVQVAQLAHLPFAPVPGVITGRESLTANVFVKWDETPQARSRSRSGGKRRA